MAESFSSLEDLLKEQNNYYLNKKGTGLSNTLIFCPLDEDLHLDLTSFRCLLIAAHVSRLLECSSGECRVFGISDNISLKFPQLKLNTVNIEESNEQLDRLTDVQKFRCNCDKNLCIDCKKLSLNFEEEKFVSNVSHCVLKRTSEEDFTPAAKISCKLTAFCMQQSIFTIFLIFPESRQNFAACCRIICRLLNPDLVFVSVCIGLVRSKDGSMTWEQYCNLRRKQLTYVCSNKYSELDETFTSLTTTLFWTTVMFEFLTKSSGKTLVLLNTDGTDNDLPPLAVDGIKVMYNYARICSIIDKFKRQVDCGHYPCLKQLEELNYDVKSKVFQSMGSFINCFKIDEIERIFTKIPSLCNKLIQFSTQFSKYYRSNQILIEPSPSLFDTLHVKIHCLLCLKQCLDRTFDVLNVVPVNRM